MTKRRKRRFLIAFPAEPAFESSRDWWRALTGADPERSVEKRQRLEREDSGLFEGLELKLSIDLLRVQWTASVRLVAEDPPEAFPTIGPFLERLVWFRDLMHQWLLTCPPLKRLALAGPLNQPVASHRDGYARLDQYLRPVDLDPDSRDFIYRINRRRLSNAGIAGLEINRLATWVVGKMAVAMHAEILGGPSARMQHAEYYACVVELDINTSEEYEGLLPNARLPAVLNELSDFALEIATNGDRRP